MLLDGNPPSLTTAARRDFTERTPLDGLAVYLAQNFVLPAYDPDIVITADVRDENGFPKFHEDSRIETQQITIREYFQREGIDLNQYIRKNDDVASHPNATTDQVDVTNPK